MSYPCLSAWGRIRWHEADRLPRVIALLVFNTSLARGASEWIVLEHRGPVVGLISRDEARMKGNGRRNGGGEGASSSTVSDAIVAPPMAWGVRRIYGFPGDGINGVLGALRRAGDTSSSSRWIKVELKPSRSQQKEKKQEAPARSRRQFDEEARA